jgi:hypothetical protein
MKIKSEDRHRHHQLLPHGFSIKNHFLLFSLLMVLIGYSSSLVDVHASSPANVLQINAYHPGYRGGDELYRGFRKTLLAAVPQTKLFEEHLDSKRIYSPPAFDRLADLIRERYRHIPFNAIIAADNNSFSFLKQHRQSLFDGIPAIFCGPDDLNPADLDGMAPITGVNEAADVREALDLALTRLPSTRRVVTVNDATRTGRNAHREIPRVPTIYDDRLVFSYWEELRLEDLLRQLPGLRTGDIVLYTYFFGTRPAATTNARRAPNAFATHYRCRRSAFWNLTSFPPGGQWR